jgi:hypothetical protein
MSVKCRDCNTGEKLVPDYEFKSRILRRTLLKLINSFPQEDRISVKDLNGNFSLDVRVGAIAGGWRKDNIQIYGGSGSDEHYSSWCFEIPFDVKEGSPKDIVDVTAFQYRKGQLMVFADC